MDYVTFQILEVACVHFTKHNNNVTCQMDVGKFSEEQQQLCKASKVIYDTFKFIPIGPFTRMIGQKEGHLSNAKSMLECS